MTRKSQKSLEVEDATLELQFKVRRNTFEKSTVDLFSYYVVEQSNGCLKHHDINSFNYYLCKKLQLSIYDGFSYVDCDGDVIYIESQDTFEDVMKFTRARNKKNKRVLLIVEPGARHSECSEESYSKKAGSISESNNLSLLKSISTTTESTDMMAPSTVNEIVEEVGNMRLEEKLNNSATTLPVSSDATPPAWFKEYMEMLKKDIVMEVSSEVMSSVTEILNKRSSEKPYHSYNHFSEDHSRRSYDIYSEELQCRNKKRVVEEVDYNYALPSFQQQNIQVHEDEKVEKCEQELKSKLNNKLELFEQRMRNILKSKKHHEVAAIVDDLDSGNMKMELNNRERNVIKDSATIVVPESVFPLSVESKYDDDDDDDDDDDHVTNVTSKPDVKLRTNCSITGQEMFNETNIKDTEYCSDFDTDDISVISDISHVSGMEPDSFEIIPMPSCIVGKFTDECGDFTNVNDPEINESTFIPSSACKNDVNFYNSEAENDQNINVDSPVFGMLPGPTSPIESIYVMENYFTTNKNEIGARASNADLIDFKTEFMFDNVIPYIMNVRGTIFEDISVDESNETTNVTLDKRPGGTYSYNNETLPSHESEEKYSVSEPETNIEERSEDNCNANADEKYSHDNNATNAEIMTSSQSSKTQRELQTDLNYVSHESTQSFSSHTTSDTGNTSAELDTGPKHVIVDHNVSKGLGEIIYPPPEPKCSSTCDKKKEARTNCVKKRRKYGFSSKNYASCPVDEPKESIGENSGRPKVSSDARLGSGEHVNILPELLVSGVEQVTFSVFSTARRVLSKMRNVQMGEDMNRMRTGW